MITGAPTPDRVNREDDSEGAKQCTPPDGCARGFLPGDTRGELATFVEQEHVQLLILRSQAGHEEREQILVHQPSDAFAVLGQAAELLARQEAQPSGREGGGRRGAGFGVDQPVLTETSSGPESVEPHAG